jgi:hypothetical protein
VAELAREFYRLWEPVGPAQPGPRDLEQAELLLRGREPEEARELLGCLVQVTRKEWPECRSLSGAVQKYLPDAERLLALQKRREAGRREAAADRDSAREGRRGQERQGEELERLWRALPAGQRLAIEERVRARLGSGAPAAFVHRLCLEEAGRL